MEHVNLIAYDGTEISNNAKLWIPKYTLYIQDIPFRKYYCFFTKYDPEIESYHYYISFSDIVQGFPAGFKVHNTQRTRKGTIKVDMKSVWNKFDIERYLTTNTEFAAVNLIIEQKVGVSELYEFVMIK